MIALASETSVLETNTLAMRMLLGTIFSSIVNIPIKIYKIVMMSAQPGTDSTINTYSNGENSKYLSKKVLAQGKVNTLKN